ncbi:hypothetical protein [Runella sp.]|uniref:hypothetical protein n=1 Tax=Runella sp. TaxID=1960881 RepID=UPI003D0EBE56
MKQLMKLDKKEAATVSNAIRFWEDSHKLSPELAEELRKSYEVRSSNVDTIAWYAFISAVSCGLLAFGALVIDEKWIELLRKRWEFSEATVGIGFTLVAGVFVYLARRRKVKYPNSQISNESYTITIALSVAVAIAYWTRSLGLFDGHYAQPILIATIIYGIIGAFLPSQLLWVAMLLSLVGWWVGQTYQWSDGGFRFAGMNYPLSITLLGLVIWASSWMIEKVKPLSSFERVTYVFGLVVFLFAAWMLSIFGNYDDLSRWSAIKQGTLWYWSAGFTVVLSALTFYAFRSKNDTLRDICLVFFLANIYTRYFEYFWDRTNKGIFFAILALSFWFVGKKAEQWRSQEKIA